MSRSRIVVVGAGITGAMIGYRLVEQGEKVTILDRDIPSRQASSNNPGGLNPLHGPGIPGRMQSFALMCLEAHRERFSAIARTSGMDFHARAVPRLEVALEPDDLVTLSRMHELYNETPGFSAKWVEGENVRRIEPRISGEVLAGAWLEGNVMVDSPRYVAALIAAGSRKGLDCHQDEVIGLQCDDLRVTGVQCKKGTIECDRLILATGPWLGEQMGWLGMSLPVYPVKGELLHVEWLGEPFMCHVSHGQDGIYRMSDGSLMLGGTWSECGFDAGVSVEGARSIREKASRIIPEIAHAKIRRHCAGLRPVTLDGLPIIGAVPGVQDVFLATGAGAKGMLYSAGMASMAAGWVAGLAVSPQHEFLSISRFL